MYRYDLQSEMKDLKCSVSAILYFPRPNNAGKSYALGGFALSYRVRFHALMTSIILKEGLSYGSWFKLVLECALKEYDRPESILRGCINQTKSEAYRDSPLKSYHEAMCIKVQCIYSFSTH